MTIDWRLAKSLMQLRGEVNIKYPKRSKDSDGAVGDTSHASRSSDHNPWIADPPGPHVVSAIDITHDPKGGFDSYAFAEWLRLEKDRRIKYVISNRRIFAGSLGPSPWVWRAYSGANPHDHHVHISVKETKEFYDNQSPWGVADATLPKHNQPQPQIVPKLLKRGHGTDIEVRVLQNLLVSHSHTLNVDGVFGQQTEIAVSNFQKLMGLHADGIVGPQTWKALLA